MELTPLQQAVAVGDLAAVCDLLADGTDINARSASGITVLHQAVEYAEPSIIEFLLRYGADPNLRAGQGQTPLHWAILRDPLIVLVADDRPRIVRLLLAYGADASARTDSGETALSLARQSEAPPDLLAMLREGEATSAVSVPVAAVSR